MGLAIMAEDKDNSDSVDLPTKFRILQWAGNKLGAPAMILLAIMAAGAYYGDRFTKWAAPMVETVITKHCQFLDALENKVSRIDSIDQTTTETGVDVKAIRASLDKADNKNKAAAATTTTAGTVN